MAKDRYEIALLPGDGIGPEVTEAAVAVLSEAAGRHEITLNYTTYEAGANYYKKTGKAMSEQSTEDVGRADAVLLGAMGLPDVRYPNGTEIAPQIDLLIIRELVEGLFAGRHDKIEESDESVSDRLTITRAGCEKLFELAFAQAKQRRRTHGTPGHVTLLDKANVLRSNAFMRKIFDEVAAGHPDVGTARLYIDAGSMMLVTNPERFDVVVTENVFGDITSEIAAGVVGGLGVAPSADVS